MEDVYIDGNDLIVNGKKVGQIYGKLYVSHRNEKDKFNKRDGYSITDKGLKLLKERGVEEIRIIEHKINGSIERYKAPIKNYMEGRLISYGRYESQRVIPVTEMEKIEKK